MPRTRVVAGVARQRPRRDGDCRWSGCSCSGHSPSNAGAGASGIPEGKSQERNPAGTRAANTCSVIVCAGIFCGATSRKGEAHGAITYAFCSRYPGGTLFRHRVQQRQQWHPHQVRGRNAQQCWSVSARRGRWRRGRTGRHPTGHRRPAGRERRRPAGRNHRRRDGRRRNRQGEHRRFLHYRQRLPEQHLRRHQPRSGT